MIICKKCGTENYEDNKFCRSCGSALENEESVKVDVSKPNKKTGGDKLLLIYKLAMLGLIVGCMILCFIPFGDIDFYKIKIVGPYYGYYYYDLLKDGVYTAKIIDCEVIGTIFFVFCCLLLVLLVVSLFVKKINNKVSVIIISSCAIICFVLGLLTFIFDMNYMDTGFTSVDNAIKIINKYRNQYGNIIKIPDPYNLVALYFVLSISSTILACSIAVTILYFTIFYKKDKKVVTTTSQNVSEGISNYEEKQEIQEVSNCISNYEEKQKIQNVSNPISNSKETVEEPLAKTKGLYELINNTCFAVGIGSLIGPFYIFLYILLGLIKTKASERNEFLQSMFPAYLPSYVELFIKIGLYFGVIGIIISIVALQIKKTSSKTGVIVGLILSITSIMIIIAINYISVLA